MSLRRDNELLSDEDGLDPQQKLYLTLAIIGAATGIFFGGFPGLVCGTLAGLMLAAIIIACLTKASDFLSRR